jgi:DNA modification methylase
MFDGWAFNLLMWHKTNTPPMVNNNYFADTEYLLYFHKGKRIWNNGLKPIDKYKKYFVSAMGQGKKDAGADLHPTMKPVALISNEIEICSNKGGVVLDCFGGSGSTLIACEQLNRKCYMCELDPHYCDVIIQRWENFTGKKAVLLNGQDEK